MNKHPSADFVAQLCPRCGLCCNGVLFATVRLQKGDDVRRLAELGLPLKAQARRPVFPQPCYCLDGTLCRIYSERPKYCRTFACGTLKRVQAGRLDVDTALAKIERARGQAEKVRQLLRRLGDHDETLALTRRYARVMREAVDLSGPKASVEGRGELMLEVNGLMETLQRDFLA